MRWIMICCAVWMVVPASAQVLEWEQVGQLEWPYRPAVGDVVRTAEGTLVACSLGESQYLGGSLYRSTDEAATWTPVELSEMLPECGLAATEDGTLFAGTRTGVYRSDDEGLTWSLSGLDLYTYDVEQGPTGRLWATAYGGNFDRALFRSDDGATWTRVADETTIGASAGTPFVGRFETVSFSPEGDVFIGAIYGFFRSGDGGDSWEEIDLDPSSSSIIASSGVMFVSSDVAYVGAKYNSLTERLGRGIYRSVDGGTTWSETSPADLFVEALVVASDGELLAGTDDGLYRSGDGLVWEPAGLNTRSLRIAAVLPGEGETPTLLGTRRGVYRSAAGGTAWVRVNEGFERVPTITGVAVSGETLFASANGEVYRYDAAQDRWRLPANLGLITSGRAFDLMPYQGELLLGTKYGLFQSYDDAEGWRPLWLSTETEVFSTVTATPPGELIIGTYFPRTVGSDGRLLFSGDEGTTWTASAGWSSRPGGSPFIITETPTGTLLVGASVGKFNPPSLYRSSDDGATWTEVDGAPRGIAVTHSGTLVAVSEEGHRRSFDDGLSWETTVSDGGNAVVTMPAGGLAAIRLDREVYISTDEGATWRQKSTGLLATVLATDAERFVYVGTLQRGVRRSEQALLVSSESVSENAALFTLAPGYPNPLAGSAALSFTLPETGPVRLSVHDVLGRRVATLVDAVLPAGEHVASWNAKQAANGVYLVTLRAGEKVATQRITVVH